MTYAGDENLSDMESTSASVPESTTWPSSEDCRMPDHGGCPACAYDWALADQHEEDAGHAFVPHPEKIGFCGTCGEDIT